MNSTRRSLFCPAKLPHVGSAATGAIAADADGVRVREVILDGCRARGGAFFPEIEGDLRAAGIDPVGTACWVFNDSVTIWGGMCDRFCEALIDLFGRQVVELVVVPALGYRALGRGLNLPATDRLEADGLERVGVTWLPCLLRIASVSAD